MQRICNDCPRKCGQMRGERTPGGVCRSPLLPQVARAAPHYGEEPCISGQKGAGTIFFTGCSLRCVFCQNHEISQGQGGKILTIQELRDTMLRLRDQGVPCALYDVSATDPSYILAEAFKYSHLLLASPTYNNGVFVKMENLLHDVAAHTLANRTVFMIQNGSWAPTAAAGMKAILEGLKGFTFAEPVLTLKSALSAGQAAEVDAFVNAIVESAGGKA